MLPNPLFYVFDKPIYAYGICIAVGILACFFVFYFYTKKAKMNTSVQDFCFIVAIIAIAVGFLAAKLFQAVYNWIGTGRFDFANAGITAMGGFIGGALAFIGAYYGIGHFYFRGKKKGIHKKEFNKILLVAPLCILIAHAFGRIGCLMSGCCHGAYLGSDYVAGGIYMHGTVDGVGRWGYYVPTQLYEALFLFLAFGVLSLMFFKRYNIIMSLYLISYGIWRIIIEIFRTDARGAIVLGLAPSQWVSILFILGGIALIVIYYFMQKPLKLNTEYMERTVTETEDVVADEIIEDKKDCEYITCKYCGATNNAKDIRCSQCGADLKKNRK